MKKLAVVLAVVLLFAAPAALSQIPFYPTPTAGTVVSLNAASANIAGTDAQFGAYPSLLVHVFGSSAVLNVVIELGSTKNNYSTVATISSPSSHGEWWSGPSAPFARCRILDDYVSGSATCVIMASTNSVLSKSWKRYDTADGVAVPTAIPTWTPTATPTGTRTPTATPTRTPTPRP